ncbi:MAG: SgcJ/EcaC family oxidoreductase [Nibricoccus sp.]
MNVEQEKQKIRGVIHDWLRATAADDLETVLSLMAEDVVFLVAGRPPMIGRNAFAAASHGMAGKMRFEGKPDILEIHVAGEYAFCWNYLSVTMTPIAGGAAVQREGNILSVFRKEPDGRWVLFRDANLLTPK